MGAVCACLPVDHHKAYTTALPLPLLNDMRLCQPALAMPVNHPAQCSLCSAGIAGIIDAPISNAGRTFKAELEGRGCTFVTPNSTV